MLVLTCRSIWGCASATQGTQAHLLHVMLHNAYATYYTFWDRFARQDLGFQWVCMWLLLVMCWLLLVITWFGLHYHMLLRRLHAIPSILHVITQYYTCITAYYMVLHHTMEVLQTITSVLQHIYMAVQVTARYYKHITV